jgi:peptide/nickel transport system permease protein
VIIFLVRRAVLSLFLLLGITVVTFGVMRLAPGGPVDAMTEMNQKISPETRQKLVKLYGLDKPWHEQYRQWLGRMTRLDFGRSFKDDRPVRELIFERLGNTLLLNVASMVLIFAVAVPLGVLSAVKQNRWVDKTVGVFVLTGFSMPTLWLALLLMTVFGLWLGWLPISGLHALNHEEMGFFARQADTARHLVLPVFLSGFTGLAGISRYVRNGLLDVLRQDYIRTARAKGLPEGRVIFTHALRNALIPVVTILGLSLPDLIGGSFIFETLFAYPGMGRLGFEAVMSRNYPVVMGVGTLAAILTLLGNFLADAAYRWVDPRIREGSL